MSVVLRPAVPAIGLRAGSAASTGALVVTAFCLVVAGPNLPTALLPAYRASYGMTPFGLSLVFSAYLAVLVPALVLCSRPALRARARTLLAAGLLSAVVADVVMAQSSSVPALMVGRAISGISVAIATGAAAALMVSLVGERGRGSVATGNIAGALLGTAAAVVLAQLGVGRDVYLAHAAATAIVGVALVVALARPSARLGAGDFASSMVPGMEIGPAAGPPVAAGPQIAAGAQVAAGPLVAVGVPAVQRVSRRHVVLGTAVGAVGWAVPGLVTGLVPALLRDFTGPGAVLVATTPAILLLGTAWALQVLIKRPLFRFVRGYELTVGTALGALGLTLLTVGAFTASLPLVYLGCVVAAGGPALGYRGGMVLLTRGLDPAHQGATTSRYAATSYVFSAVVVVGAGALGAIGGMVTAVAVGAGLLAVAAVVLLVCILVGER